MSTYRFSPGKGTIEVSARGKKKGYPDNAIAISPSWDGDWRIYEYSASTKSWRYLAGGIRSEEEALARVSFVGRHRDLLVPPVVLHKELTKKGKKGFLA